MNEPYEIAAEYLIRSVGKNPEVGIICGSGLSGLSKVIEDPVTVPYDVIPGFPLATVAGHVGELVFGTMNGVSVVCLRGRFHFYEGNDMPTVALPVRVMKLIGVKMLVVTNAAGGLNPNYEVGDIAIIQDHFGGVGAHYFLTDASFDSSIINILTHLFFPASSNYLL
jgi:purine-nucleoside phosphorylase